MKSFLVFIAILSSLTVHAQIERKFDIETAPMHANPAFTGVRNYGALNANAELIAQDIFQVDASYQTALPKVNSGIGLMVANSSFFDFNQTVFGASYSYQQKITDKLTLSAGISGLLRTSTFDGFSQGPIRFFMNTGLLLYNDRFFASLAFHEINYNQNLAHVSTMAGYAVKLKTMPNFVFTPILGFESAGQFRSVNARLNVAYKNYKLMVGVQPNDQVFAGLGYDHQNFTVHYVLGLNTSSLAGISNFENRVSLGIKMPKFITRNSPKFDMLVF